MNDYNLTHEDVNFTLPVGSTWNSKSTIYMPAILGAALAFNVTLFAARTRTTEKNRKEWEQTEQDWLTGKNLSGHKVLVGDKIIWISEFDMKYFQEAHREIRKLENFGY